MIITNLGFPRIGPKRELKTALERCWNGASSADEFLAEARRLRAANWELQAACGIEHIPSNDASPYDHVLDTCAMVGAVPERYGWTGGLLDLDTYFRMARGGTAADGRDVTAMEMTKWFDTNYHYIVPELTSDQQFTLASTKPIDEFREAHVLGIRTRPVLLGPVSFLLLGKARGAAFYRLALLDRLLPVYAEVLTRLADAGAEWVQVDEPCLVGDLDAAARCAYVSAYLALAGVRRPKILLATSFGGLGEDVGLAERLLVDGLHVDLVRAPEQLDAVLGALPGDRVLSAGVVDGRNVWRNDLEHSLLTLERIAVRIGEERLWVAPSCSLLFVPVDLEAERDLDPTVGRWLAFAVQKLRELAVLGRGIRHGRSAVASALAEAREALAARRSSPIVRNPEIRDRLATIARDGVGRQSPAAVRRTAQREALALPLLPTTSIGSFPQTPEIRQQRRAFETGALSQEAYERFLEDEVARVIRFQEAIGCDVLVHGEPERNDMVQYFGERLDGFACTRHGWVQSYGSRCVRPPIIVGDVARPAPMTVRWATHAQSLTAKPVKGMLTGPVTILQWSFVRDDQPRAATCRQIALAIRDEVRDLEAAGIRIIQIDEPALREGLPIRRAEWSAYLTWAAECFRLASAAASDRTQVHTHMCYSEFGDIIDAIDALDADVLSIEASRSDLELLDAFARYRYPRDIGPGVYDIHSPRVPTTEEIADILRRLSTVLHPQQLWVNPDCGLKTRRWEEVRPALTAMVDAARRVREELRVRAA